jgi:tRNA nucleotidyltransferase/poly(A) polymerase
MIPPRLLRLEAALGPDAQLTLVGGAVRDELLGRPHADWDLATALLPEAVMARARAAGLRVIPTGIQHGTVTVILDDEPMEITTFRSDGDYLDGRRPESVRLGVSLAEDLARRDFTINAMALPLEGGGLVDPHGGQADLRAGLIRAVGDPLDRFGEDGLRPLRACRFAAQLGFRIEAATLAAIPQRLEVARKVAVERVFTELNKLLTGAQPRTGLELLRESGLLDLCLPELGPMKGCGQNRHHRFDVWDHTLEVVRLAPPDPALRWAALLHDAGKPGARTLDATGEAHFHGHEARSLEIAAAVLARLKAGHGLVKEVLALVRHHGIHPEPGWSDGACRRFLRRLSEDGLPLERWAAFRLADQRAKGIEDPDREPRHAAVMARLEALAATRPPMSARDLALDGAALMALTGRKGGPWLGALQAELLEAVLEDPDRNTTEGLAPLVRVALERISPAGAAPPPGQRGPRPGR